MASAISGLSESQNAPPESFQASASPQRISVSRGSAEADTKRQWMSDYQAGHLASMTESSPPVYGVKEDNRQRHRARHSGGFLLQDAAPTYTYDSLKPARQRNSHNIKGKGKEEDGHAIYAKCASGTRHRQKPSIGSSPLSTVVYHGAEESGNQSIQSDDSDQILPTPPDSSGPRTASRNEAPNNNQASRSTIYSSAEEVPSAIGHNTDPAQIVNLALNLSESRRRNVSGGRLPPAYNHQSRRHVSSDQYVANRPLSIAGANLRKHLNDQRRISRPSAPRSSADPGGTPSPKSTHSGMDGQSSSVSSPRDSNISQEALVHPSEATLARAERARIAFELSYEYRRLLQYLPRLPLPTSSKTGASKSSNGIVSGISYSTGRVYDPLQYIRNRRVRGRERKYLDAEAEGFKDPDQVKLWIDRVAHEYQNEDAQEKGLDKSSLPPLLSVQADAQSAQDPLGPGVSMHITPRPSKSEKQSSNWAFTPWDLLADTAWLSRDENIRSIEDANGNKLLPAKKLSKTNTPRASLEQARPSKRSLSIPRTQAQEVNGSLESGKKLKKSRMRDHIRGKSYEANSPIRDDGSPQYRKKRWRTTFTRSRNPSDSEGSISDGAVNRAWGRHHDREGFDSAALEKHMLELLAKEIEDDPFTDIKKIESTRERQTREQDGRYGVQAEGSKNDKTPNRPANQSRIPEQQTPSAPSTKRQSTLRDSLDEQRGRQPRVSLDGLDVTSPNSPSDFKFGPSIFINHSAPSSRSVSPKKTLPSRLKPSLHARTDSRRSVSETDFAAKAHSPIRSGPPHEKDVDSPQAHQAIQKSDSASNLLSPVAAELFGKRFRRLNDSSTSVRASKEPESRFKGLLKGTRIAALVGNEVSRVGDMIWRRDASHSRPTSPVSARASLDSDTDGGVSTLDNSPETDLSRVTTSNDDAGNLSRKPTRNNQPKFHYQNLPTFRSSISQASPGSPIPTSPEDHPITRQQNAQKARGRSSKFDRLAPPRIDMRSISPSPSRHRNPAQREKNEDESRGTSSSRSTHGVRSADRRLNDVLGIPGTVHGPSPTGLTSLAPSTTKRPSHENSRRPALDDSKRKWSISARSLSAPRSADGSISKRDISRVRALLLSSGIKANEIARQANTIDDPPFLPQLRELRAKLGGQVPQVPRCQEPLLAARLIDREIDAANQQLRDAAEEFSARTVEELHARFRALDELVTGTRIPAARKAADEADSLNAELTTTRTLEVRDLGERVERGLRKRRRRGRWVRRAAWVGVEWGVVAVLWCVWGLVVVLRVVRGGVRAVVGFVRWMLWVD
ncbi:MAG: hypothetical protein LQ350_004841 [Teloschistes chrysophthalmus]|nr:MAG: hypothetical protein LQ350_004841 [Niorma chrysophthalma]